MNSLTKFFGLYDGSKNEQVSDMYQTIESLYAKIASLKADLYALENRPTVQEEDADTFLSKSLEHTYPGLSVFCHGHTPPVTLEMVTYCTSFFYSDGAGRFMYVDSPLHSWRLKMTKQGLSSVENESEYNMRDYYGEVNDLASDYIRLNHLCGHPHCSQSQRLKVITENWCFGNNTGVDDLLAHANDLTAVGMLFRKIYHWLTEINVDSMYHSDVYPLQLRTYGNVWNSALGLGNIIHDTYKECFEEVIAHLDNPEKGPITIDLALPLVSLIKQSLNDLHESSRFRKYLKNLLGALGELASYPYVWMLCLYQFATACVLLSTGGDNLRSVVSNVAGADLFLGPFAWTQRNRSLFIYHPEKGELNYPKAYRHYFDGFEYALKGGF